MVESKAFFKKVINLTAGLHHLPALLGRAEE